MLWGNEWKQLDGGYMKIWWSDDLSCHFHSLMENKVTNLCIKNFHFASNSHKIDLLNKKRYLWILNLLIFCPFVVFLSVITLLMWLRLYSIYTVLINAVSQCVHWYSEATVCATINSTENCHSEKDEIRHMSQSICIIFNPLAAQTQTRFPTLEHMCKLGYQEQPSLLQWIGFITTTCCLFRCRYIFLYTITFHCLVDIDLALKKTLALHVHHTVL